ncbi:hypothetical protein [Alkalibacterium sp. 20]|uniref:IS1096 element passenger TnpR family protein n=1 Tax=Alkalibacterium sp. 20 TaxID=1798803 RepID=UPI0009F811C6|nr:hypothetical protein [Alkalibacterium sp. 20]
MNEINEEIYPVRLRLELVSEYLSSDEKVMLKRYGESSTGESIVRELMIPSDMTLHALHYAIQKLFGWQNSHLRQFYLPEEVHHQLTKGTVKGWSNLVGVLFQPPSEGEHDLFWDDDYESGSVATWLRKKYTGPYHFYGQLEQYDAARQDIEAMLNRFKELEIRESFSDYRERKKKKPDAEPEIVGTASLIDMTLKEMNASIALESGTENLLEKLLVTDILAYEDEDTSGSGFPVTSELYYEYDFGDSWKVRLTKKADYADLLTDYSVTPKELEEASETVMAKHKPVCLARDGLSVMDDVGGLSGFANFLRAIYEGEDKEEAADYRSWAKSMGWKQTKVMPRKVL